MLLKLGVLFSLRPGTAVHTSLAYLSNEKLVNVYNHCLSIVSNGVVQVVPETEGAKQARLRRLCERKPTGKLQCPDWLHEQWKNPANRQSLVEKFEAMKWNKDWGLYVTSF